MDFQKLARRAQGIYEERRGSEAARKDADEIKAIAKGPGTLAEKARRTADALKDPGGPGRDEPSPGRERP